MDFGFLSRLRWGLTAGASRWGEGSIKGISSSAFFFFFFLVLSFYLRSREVEALGKVGIASLRKAGDPSLLLSKFILSVTPQMYLSDIHRVPRISQGLCTLRRLEKSSGLRDLHSGPEVWLGSFFVFQRTGCCLTESESDSVVSNSL